MRAWGGQRFEESELQTLTLHISNYVTLGMFLNLSVIWG